MYRALHSNLVIFKYNFVCIVFAPNVLYIPIWLYSNAPKNSLLGFPKVFTFQSGYIQMLESVLTPCSNPALHSNLVIFKSDGHSVCCIAIFLYIPIWLYSNGNALEPAKALQNFTFQSGYIQINWKIRLLLSSLNFTFQSGYIQILLCVWLCRA